MQGAKHAWPDDATLIREVLEAGGWAAYGRKIGRSRSTIQNWAASRGLFDQISTAIRSGKQADAAAALAAVREEAEDLLQTVSRAKTGETKPHVAVKGDNATVVTRPAPQIGEPEEWVREAGLDPEEWEAYNIKLNTWDAMTSDKSTGDNRVVPMFQVTANCRRKVKLDWLFPAVDVVERPVPRPALAEGEPQRVVFFPDQHAPYHDEGLHYLALCHLDDWKPHRIVNLGDICDFPSISKHRDNPAYFASARECVQTGFKLLHDQRAAAPDAVIDLIEGNHDARPRTELLQRAERMYDFRQATWPGEEIPASPWSLQHVLHLDRLHVNFIGPELEGDNYFQGVLELAPDLAAVHGFITGSNSASGTIERLGQSVFFGHSHRQKVHHVTKYKGRNPVAEWVGVECGTMRGIRGGGGFAFNPNWQQGYATATIWPDGEFTYDLARFDGSKLTWRDRRYR